MNPPTSFRTNLRKLRIALGVTQESLAHDAGTSSSYVSAIENGKSSPTLVAMDRLAKALGVRLSYLMANRVSISILSDTEIEIGAVAALPAIKVVRQKQKPTGRPPKKI